MEKENGPMDLETALDLVQALVAAARRDPCDPATLDAYAVAYWRVIDALRRVP